MGAEPTSKPPFSKKRYILGLAIGSIPLLCILLGGRVVNTLDFIIYIALASVMFYLIVIILALIIARKQRELSYGLWTVVFVYPVVAYIGCIVIK